MELDPEIYLTAPYHNTEGKVHAPVDERLVLMTVQVQGVIIVIILYYINVIIP